MDDQDWWLAVAGEISVLQEGALRAGVHVERLGALEAQVAQLQNVLEVVCAELEAGHKTTHALEKRALAAEGALERANERARAAEDELARQRRTASAPLRQGHSHGTATTGAPPGSPQADHERAHQIGALYAELVGDAERARRGRQMQPNGTKLALTRLSPSKGIHKSLPGSPQSARSGSAPIMGSAQKAALRQTYGADSHFEAIKDSYFNGAGGQDDLTDRDKTHRWLRGIMSSKSVVDADPKHVDKLVRQLQSLCLQHGINLPLKRTGPCQYSLGSSRMSLKTINGKLMVRCGGGYEHILSAVEKLPVPLHS
ncbi:hypothetical protein WJX72_000190 [[Myrmecia] bisecta]|uniref:Uncharacterized protein n=1 Tax=[Myrmecia] bisecta TaxID=41462 RepID=A0AAW1QDX5_9CHLO